MVLVFHGITHVIILGFTKPYKLKSKNRDELINEGLLMIIVYHMIVFTDFVADLETTYYTGYSCAGIVSLHILLNLSMMLYGSLYTSILHFKRWRLIRKYAKVRSK